MAAAAQCQRIREAQFAFRSLRPDEAGSFAKRIRSTPGHHDGLYWEDSETQEESLLGPVFAAAAFSEQSEGSAAEPLAGYYFRILIAQGPAAHGGAFDYRVKNQLRKGFAVVAWPARYGVDGVHTFVMSHTGDIYQKDLGPDTGREAESMTLFNPDRSWSHVGFDDGMKQPTR